MKMRRPGSQRSAGQRIRTDYREYSFTAKELAKVTAVYAAASCAVVWLFYMRLPVLLLALPIYPLFLRMLKKERAAARRKKLCYEFRAALNSLSVSLRAGRSVESAFPEAVSDLRQSLGDESDITREFADIARGMRLSVPAEELILDLADRSGVEDIENFAAVFFAAKRSGGDMAGIIRSAAESIEGKIDVEREIDMSLASKKMEQKIMTAMPAMIIVYMRLASPGFLDLMYTTALGALVMTGCLGIYAFAVWWSGRIVDIEI